MKITERLTLVLLMMSLVTLSVTGVVSYTIAKRALTDQVLDQLQSVASIQENRLIAIVEQNLERLALISSRTQLCLNFKSYMTDPKIGLLNVTNRMLQDSRESIHGIRKISMLTLDGGVMASTDPAEIGAQFGDQECFLSGQAKSSINELYLDDEGHLSLHLSGPLRVNDALLGVIVIDVDARDIISLVKDHTGLGETGETLLGKLGPEGNGIFLTPLRFDEDAALRRRVAKKDLESPAMQALLKNEGLFLETVDYRGEPVWAATRYIEATGWGLAVKIDASEAFEPIARLGHLLMFFVLIASALAVYVSLYLARSITSPIANLTNAADRIAEGDLEARVKPTSNDEIGSLGQAFDQMAQALETDIARRERAEARAEHLNAVLRGIRNVNQLIVSDPDRDTLIQGACNNLTRAFGYDIAWIALLDEFGALISSARSGASESHPEPPEQLESRDIPHCGRLALAQPEPVVVGSRSPECLDCPLVFKAGSKGHMSARLQHEGKVYGFISVAMDVSFVADEEDRRLFQEVAKDIAFSLRKIEQRAEHERLEEELRASEQQLEAIATSAQDGIVMTDNDGNVSFWNDAAERIFGYARDEILGKNLHQTLAPKEYHEAHEKGFHSFRNSGQGAAVGKTLELSALKKDGTRFPVELSLSSVRLRGKWCAVGIVRDVTERKRAQEALRQSEERYRTLFSGAAQGILIADGETRELKYANPAICRTLGYSEAELTNMNVSDIHPRESLEHVIGEFEAQARGEKGLSTELPCLRKDGVIIYADVIASPCVFDGRRHNVGFFTDVTERKQAKEALCASEERFRALIETSPDSVWEVDENAAYTYMSPRIRDIRGYSPEEVLGKTPFDLMPAEEAARVAEILAPFVESHKPFLSLENTNVHKDGHHVVVETNGVPFFDTDGTFRGFRGIDRDITARKRSEEALRESEARYRALFEASADGILITDVETRELKYANPAICRMLGYSEGELAGLTLNDIHPKESLAHVVSEFQSSARGEKASGEGIPCLRRDGTQIQADVSGATCEIDGRKCSVGFFRDITERKMLQSQLAQAQKLEAIGRLAAGIAHEINTPTQYVGDNISFMGDASADLWRLLSEYGKLLEAAKEGSMSNELVSSVSALAKEVDVAYLNKEMRAATDQAKEGVERISSIVRAMRQFAHPGAEEKAATDINGAIENTITVSRNEWKYVADVETDLDPDLPPVQLLAGEFNQVILNMIVNAAHSIANVVGDGEGGKGKITIKTRRDGEVVEIRVSDTGTGVPEKHRDRVFDPFFTTKEVGKGTGQGLAIAHAVIVEKHNGTIALESEEGKGATFIIRLPIDSGQDNDEVRQ